MTLSQIYSLGSLVAAIFNPHLPKSPQSCHGAYLILMSILGILALGGI